MATVLSRALKLPGKKSHDPREYDPLTQADSDESEDDLVINIQHNGLQNGKGGHGASNDSDGERVSKRVHQRQIDSKQDSLSGGGGLEPQPKATSSLVSYVRTTVFLLTVVVSMIMVLVCAFLIPCPPGSERHVWYLDAGYEPEVSSPLELFDVNRDGVPDILVLSVSPGGNASHVEQKASVSAFSGGNGSVLWKRRSEEYLRSILCGQLLLRPQQNDTCLLTGTSKLLTLISASTGATIWSMDPGHVYMETMAAPAVVLPDLDEDNTSDLLILTVGENQPDLGFLLVSGLTGKPLGGIVKYNRMGEGKVIDPQAYYTSQGAIYILFGFGNIQAVALRDIYAQAKNRDSFPSVLQKSEPDWEKRRSVNLSKLISVYSADVEFLQTIPVFGNNCSDLLVTTKEGLSLLKGLDLEPIWKVGLKNIYSVPQPGYFNADGNLDFFVQIQSSADVKKVVVIDGSTSAQLWEWEVLWREREVGAMSLLTADGKSLFLFWGEGRHAENSSASDTKPPAHLNRHLYLLYPTYPGVVLDLFNVTASVVAAGGGIVELEKDVVLAVVTAEGGQDKLPRNLSVAKLGMKWALSNSRALSLGHVTMKAKVDDVKRILARLKFSSVPQRLL